MTTTIKPATFEAKVTDWLGQEIHAGDRVVYPARHPDGTKTMVLAEVIKLSVERSWGRYVPKMMVRPIGESRKRNVDRTWYPVLITAFEAVTKLSQRDAA
ncbi:hypothetical protein AB0G15_05550 [Streptosporangium sp. NPDC023825]|uniref:hypothetical protein n=1 Tax=Streptosporangium sp. NPDC023825 TaxID=3154909 RepID=UPI003429E848